MTQRSFLTGVIAATLAAAAFASSATLMSVQVRKAEVRDTPSFLGNVVIVLGYATQVSVQEQNGSWMKVVPPNGQPAGWLHSSALTRKTIVMQAGDAAPAAASSGEMALAGKGFNADVEKEFKANHKDVDFSVVDRMEKIKIAPAKLQAFAREGGLLPKGREESR